MSPGKSQAVVEVLDINLDSKDMRVLGAILTAQLEPTDYVSFDEIREHLAVIEGGRRGEDPLVYRSLSSLEKAGFIEVMQQGKLHGYRSNTALLQGAVKLLLVKATEEANSTLEAVEEQINNLESIDEKRLAESLLISAMGSAIVEEEKTLFAQGWNDVLNLIDKKIYRNLATGDVVRITLEWVNQPDNVEARRLLSIEEMVSRGIVFRAMDHRKQDIPRLERYREITRRMRGQGYDPRLQISPREDATYQFIARNEDGIVLIVSENPLSATWIPRSANPELVDDAIANFDADFVSGEDIFDYKVD